MKTIDLKKFNVGPSDKFLFDTNIWIYLYAPIAGTDAALQSKYAQLLKEIISRGATVFITSVIVSEYVNRSLRIAFNNWKRANGLFNADFKRDYRCTKEYESDLNAVKIEVKAILASNSVSQKPDNFHNINIDDIFNRMSENCDYNDAYIIKTCEQDNIILVSNDKDFQNLNSPVKLIM